MCLALVFALGAEAKRSEQGAKAKAEKRVLTSQELGSGRAPAQAGQKKSGTTGLHKTSPLLYDTATPQWAQPRGGDGYSCEASTAYYGKTCTSRFLSF